jgi:bifunctional DNA-binding transcriptional regulator/antitoxin component of YhaV-PrlF toxin-antitoxin module
MAARGQITVAAPVRERIGLKEGDIIDWVAYTAAELCECPKDQVFLVAAPSRPHPISLQTLRELDETVSEAKRGKALGIADLVDHVTANQQH